MLLEKQDYIRMKQKEEIAENKELIKAQEDGIELRDDVIRKQAIEIEKKHDQIVKQGSILQFQDKKIEDATNQLEKLTLEIDDIESLLQDVSDVAYEKAVEEVTNEVMIKTRQDDIQLIEGTKNWIDQPQRKASEKEKGNLEGWDTRSIYLYIDKFYCNFCSCSKRNGNSNIWYCGTGISIKAGKCR